MQQADGPAGEKEKANMWSTFFRDGGWGMYPTAIFGFLLVAACVLWVIRPERRFVPIAVSLGIATLAAGFLGTAVGMIKSFRVLYQLAPERQLQIAAMGCAESLNDLVLALLIVVPSALIFSLGAVRASLASNASNAAA